MNEFKFNSKSTFQLSVKALKERQYGTVAIYHWIQRYSYMTNSENVFST